MEQIPVGSARTTAAARRAIGQGQEYPIVLSKPTCIRTCVRRAGEGKANSYQQPLSLTEGCTVAQPIDLIVCGLSMSFRHAWQAALTMSSAVSKTRLESQLARRYCRMFSTGLSSGTREGNRIGVMS